MKHFTGNEFNENGTIHRDGHIVIYAPWHPNCWKISKLVYLHRLIMENKLIRFIDKEEKIHHIDENPLNNSLDNLIILSNMDHASLHKKSSLITKCKKCHKIVKQTRHDKYCSKECSSLGLLKITDEEIIKIYNENKNLPLYKMCKLMNISDVRLKKRLIRLNLYRV